MAALLFDLDDTLYAYAPCNEAALVAAHACLTADVDITSAAFRAVHDDVRAELARRLAGQPASHDRTLFFKAIVEHLAGVCRPGLALRLEHAYWNAFLDRMQLAPRALDVLAALAQRWPLALVSNQMTHVQLRKLDRLGLGTLFGVVATSEETGTDKPDPRVFERALTALGATAEQAVMIGDDPRGDVRGAAALGMRTVLSTQFEDRRAQGPAPDAVIETLDDLPALLDRWL